MKSYDETCQNITRHGKKEGTQKRDGRLVLDVPLTSMSTGDASFKSWLRFSRFPSEDAFQRGETMVEWDAFCGTDGRDGESGVLEGERGRMWQKRDFWRGLEGRRPRIFERVGKRRRGEGEQPHLPLRAIGKIGLDNRPLIISPDMASLFVQPRPPSDSPAQPTASRSFSAPASTGPVVLMCPRSCCIVRFNVSQPVSD